MKQNSEKIIEEAARDRCWADLRDNKDEISQLMMGKKKINEKDFILFFQCAVVVLAEINMYEDEFLDFDTETKRLLEDKSKTGALMRNLREVGYWRDIVDENLPMEKKMNAINNFRKNMWAFMALKKERLIEVVDAYPGIKKEKEMYILMQCVALTALEIELRGIEIELLY